MSSVFENILGFSLKWRFTTAGCFEIPGAFFFRVESRIAEAVCKNERIIKLGMQFEFKDVLNR